MYLHPLGWHFEQFGITKMMSALSIQPIQKHNSHLSATSYQLVNTAAKTGEENMSRYRACFHTLSAAANQQVVGLYPSSTKG